MYHIIPVWRSEHFSEYLHGVLDARGLRGGGRVQLLLAQDLHPVEQLVPLEHAHSEPEHPVRKVLQRRKTKNIANAKIAKV